MRLVNLGIGIGVVVSVAACGGALQPADGGPASSSGAGGNSGTGGSSSAGGNSGVGGSPPGGSGGSQSLPPVPACVTDLIASCPLEGACMFARNDAGYATPYCFPSGRTLETEYVIGCSGVFSAQALTVITVRNADGSVCYTRESRCTCNFACEDSRNTWKNARGEVVAEGAAHWTRSIMCSDGSGSASVTCSVGGSGPPGCLTWGELPGGPDYTTTRNCTEGTCALP